jgi:hypothetical protein
MERMGIFSQYKGLTREASFCISLDSKFLGVPESMNPECRVAGPWLLSKNEWLEQMKNSREINKEMYFSRFPPSLESLSKYLLGGPLGNENQVLFLVIDRIGRLHGHVGLKVNPDGNVEIDNVLRLSNSLPGVMKITLNEVIHWGNRNLGFNQYSLKVISTNFRAIKLYNDLGFTLREKQFLKFTVLPDGVTNLIPTSKEDSNTKEEMFTMEKVFDGPALAVS